MEECMLVWVDVELLHLLQLAKCVCNQKQHVTHTSTEAHMYMHAHDDHICINVVEFYV